MKKVFSFVLLFLPLLLVAQREITIDDFTTRNTFAQRSVYGINWMNDGKFYSSQDGNKVVKFDITTGQAVETLLDGDALTPKLSIQSYSFSSDEKKLLLLTEREGIYRRSYKAEYFIYDLNTKTLQKLSDGGKQSYATFSPDATKVAFVRENNLLC